MDNTCFRYDQIKARADFVQLQNEHQLAVLAKSIIDLRALEERQTKVLASREYYARAVDLIYSRSVRELKDTLNCALAFIFDDREFEVDISLNDKRGKSLTLIIYNQGNPVSLKDGMGMGVNCAISAILQIYYLCCKSSKILCLDEAYHNVAHEYLPRFFDFISKLCKSLGFTLALITHDERAIVFADKLYKVHRGVIKGDTVE